MYALSLWEPHATAIAEGIKKYETRGWDLEPQYVGVPVAIHAAKKVFREQDYEWEWFKEVRDRLRAVDDPLHRLSYGRVVCIATFAFSEPTRATRLVQKDLFWGDFRDVGDDGRRRFAFKIADVRKIPYESRPLIVGRQKFFHVPNEIGLWG